MADGQADALAVLAGATFVDGAEADSALRSAVVDDLHLRELRRGCGCAICADHLRSDP